MDLDQHNCSFFGSNKISWFGLALSKTNVLFWVDHYNLILWLKEDKVIIDYHSPFMATTV